MRKPYQLPSWIKNSSYYIVPRSGFKLTTSRLHSFIMAEVTHALNHSAMVADNRIVFDTRYSRCKSSVYKQKLLIIFGKKELKSLHR